MANDYSALLRECPEIISADQLYRICKISKRKAKWLLDNGIIPCQNNGKKTHRYRIRIEDVVEYLRTRETNPQAVTPPTGLFNEKKKTINPIALISRVDFEHFLYAEWQTAPDALTAADIQILTGYALITIKRWICHQKLQSVSLPTETLVAKQWLVEFMSEYTVTQSNHLSKKNSQLAKKYLKTK